MAPGQLQAATWLSTLGATAWELHICCGQPLQLRPAAQGFCTSPLLPQRFQLTQHVLCGGHTSAVLLQLHPTLLHVLSLWKLPPHPRGVLKGPGDLGGCGPGWTKSERHPGHGPGATGLRPQVCGSAEEQARDGEDQHAWSWPSGVMWSSG